MLYGFKTKEQAQREVDKMVDSILWARDFIEVGMAVKFKGSRSTTGRSNVHREVIAIKPSNSRAYEIMRAYENPDYVEFEHDIPFRYGTPEYQEAYASARKAYEDSTTEHQRLSWIPIESGVHDFHIVSKNVNLLDKHPELSSTVVAENLASTLQWVMVDGEWKKASDLIKAWKASRET